MEIRRINTRGSGLRTEIREDAASPWRVAEDPGPLGYRSPFTAGHEADHAARAQVPEGGLALPFQPLSFRDFMFYEQHNIDAAKGFTRQFQPRTHKFGELVEKVTRRTFKPYLPKPLWYKEPIYYMSNAVTFVPSGTPISFPSYSRALDYELEIGFVLNRRLRDADPEQAESAIGAFVLLCDFSARDVQIPEMRSGFGPQKSKHFVSSLSETAVTPEAVLPVWRKLTGSVRINGALVAAPSAEGARYSLGEAIAHASRSEDLLPGELFGTGTLPGGSGMEKGVRLRPGDRLELELPGVGRIRHDIR
ncbi:fumarylacetoacetate hydrolase family protein (plasmid) [Streptomyces sp. HUAS 31]|uniref:fumarylacetoacetate hydrolase family protein n=1 Tax=Streptomyces sp. HUAS 31 TaxID=3020055 RepID=UPI0023051747|nr:fumarylacetoacetate hydrolase family protein [Streptomyces sp. HUAS 31]WCE02462.1 fumarylacetoacetate hydrolase family protein [Streptomyces sp. HUAS 31]